MVVHVGMNLIDRQNHNHKTAATSIIITPDAEKSARVYSMMRTNIKNGCIEP